MSDDHNGTNGDGNGNGAEDMGTLYVNARDNIENTLKEKSFDALGKALKGQKHQIEFVMMKVAIQAPIAVSLLHAASNVHKELETLQHGAEFESMNLVNFHEVPDRFKSFRAAFDIAWGHGNDPMLRNVRYPKKRVTQPSESTSRRAKEKIYDSKPASWEDLEKIIKTQRKESIFALISMSLTATKRHTTDTHLVGTYHEEIVALQLGASLLNKLNVKFDPKLPTKTHLDKCLSVGKPLLDTLTTIAMTDLKVMPDDYGKKETDSHFMLDHATDIRFALNKIIKNQPVPATAVMEVLGSELETPLRESPANRPNRPWSDEAAHAIRTSFNFHL